MLQTPMIVNHHKLGVTQPVFEGLKLAASGDPDWLVEYTKVFLDSVGHIGMFTALSCAEAVAYLAAAVGGESHKRFLADVLERQTECAPPEGVIVPEHITRLGLWQAAHIYDEIGDQQEVQRLLAKLVALGDPDAAAQILDPVN